MKILFLDLGSRGLGRLRRTVALAQGLAGRNADLSILVATGSSTVGKLDIHPGIDWVRIPATVRLNDGKYVTSVQGVNLEDLILVRTELVVALCRSYQPDIIFVDQLPQAEGHETTTIIRHAKELLPNSHFALVVRDIVDESATVVEKWNRINAYALIDELFDSICVFGCPWIYDVAAEYQFTEPLRAKTRYYGYISKSGAGLDHEDYVESGEVLVTVGGGVDGLHVIEAFLDAYPTIEKHFQKAVIVAGPDMGQADYDRCHAKSAGMEGIEMLRFLPDVHLKMAKARLTISMAGYNTVSEILQCGAKAILVPRSGSGREQHTRAKLFSGLGYVEMLDPDRLSGAILADLIQTTMGRPNVFPRDLRFDAIEVLEEQLPVMARII